MLRRLEKRIIVDLPTKEARAAMFLHHLPFTVTTNEENGLEITADLDYDYIAEVLKMLSLLIHLSVYRLQH